MSLVRFRPEAPRCGCSSSGRAPPCQGGGSEFEPRHPLQKDKERNSVPYFIRYRGQVVRQESAKLSFASSNLAGTSKKEEPERVLLFCCFIRFENLNAARMSAAGEGWIESSHNFLSAIAERKRTSDDKNPPVQVILHRGINIFITYPTRTSVPAA